MVDLGCFDNHFSRGKVFVYRVDKIAKDKLTERTKTDKIRKIKNNFGAISYDELASANREHITNLEQFMTNEPDENYYCKVQTFYLR